VFVVHREFDPTESPFKPRLPLGLYLLTAIVVALLLHDLAPYLIGFAQWLGVEPGFTVAREFYGFRYALIAAVLGGARILIGALEKLTEGHIVADLAVGVACIAAILLGEPLIAAEVVVISLIGECLEAFTFGRTQSALGKLQELFPLRTWVLRNGIEERIFTANVVVGDRVVVKPGGKIPSDGVVVEGHAAVDLSALTGESLPVEKGPGSQVLAGTMVPTGSLIIDVQKVSSETVAGQVVALTAKALADKSQGERLADRVAKIFLPIVLGLAALTFAFNVLWQLSSPVGSGPDAKRLTFLQAARIAAYPTLGVLVVACPCPLILATPAAVMAALARLAGTGVLIKSGAALERLANVKTFAFDKTGTLTEGRLELGYVGVRDGTSREELLTLTASAEAQSEHPIARAILDAVPGEREPVTGFQAFPGAGLLATLTGQQVTIGTRAFLQSHGVNFPIESEGWATQLDALGETALWVARDGECLGVIGVRDTLRPEAAGVIDDLKLLGITPIAMLTGDRRTVAVAVAGNLPGLELHAEQMPADKAAWVAAQPGPVAFVGDGINDAPALARASVGLAVGTGTEIAAEVGDVVLLGEPLLQLPLLVKLSRQTVRVIRQNILVFGFGMNLVGVLLTGWFWPVFATSAEWFEKAPLVGVIYHQLGSLLVLLNSMRLLTFERTSTHRTIIGVRKLATDLDRWTLRWNLDDVLHEVTHRWKPITLGVGLLALLAWFASGIVQVNVNEVAVVKRFGAMRDNLEPGLHFRWPYPVEAITKVRPAEVKIVEVGFRLLPDDKAQALEALKREQQKLRRPGTPASDTGMTWASAHSEALQPITQESLMATGDGYLVEIFASVRYHIAEPQKFLTASSDPEGTIRNVAEATFRELAAGQAYLELLTTTRGEFETQATARFTARLQLAAPTGLGIEFLGLTIHDLHPPQEVVRAYHDAAEAVQRRDKAINDAHSEALRVKQRAQENSLRMTRQAEAAATTKVTEATAARDAFLAWAKSRRELPAAVEMQLQAEIESRVKAGQDRAAVTNEVNTRREKLLVERRMLTDFRLSLDAVTLVLQGRDKILIDAASLPGKRHILLMDPESRLPPIAFPPRANPE
jgi:P-type Cu+ transporter